MVNLITENIGIWTTAQISKTNGRGNRKKNHSPYGITKLRELILELAVRGKLVPQDPNEEPANRLLEKSAQEKAQLVKEGKIKEQKPLPGIGGDERPFELPDKWEWARLGDVTTYGLLDKAEVSDVTEYTWVLELEDVEKISSRLLDKVRFTDRPFLSSKNRFYKGDVIYGKLRPYLDKVIVADENGVCTTEMIPIRGYKNIIPQYIRLVMKSPYFIRYANESTHGMNLPRMGTDKARLALFPMVSEREQHRIVTKVNELMALCDQLEQQQTESNAANQTLVETLLATLTTAASQAELGEAWQRINSHFDTLFATEHSIDQLKQTILQLAIMGKLAPQYPNDEPASVLLEKIAKEKGQLIKEGKIKKQKPLPEISEDEKPFELPRGWEWIRFGSLLLEAFTGLDRGKSLQCPDMEYLYFKMNNILNNGGFDLTHMTRVDATQAELEIYSLENGDFLFNTRNSRELVGKTCVIRGLSNEPVIYNNNILRSKLPFVSPEFIDCWFRSVSGKLLLEEKKSSTTNVCAIYQGKLFEMLCIIPPLPEQHRIVAKSDELMALCDTLKSNLNDAQATQVQLADAIVERSVA